MRISEKFFFPCDSIISDFYSDFRVYIFFLAVGLFAYKQEREMKGKGWKLEKGEGRLKEEGDGDDVLSRGDYRHVDVHVTSSRLPTLNPQPALPLFYVYLCNISIAKLLR